MDHSKMQQKTAVRYAKTGPAIYHSHHDMIRFWERAVKRAGLPMRLTQGFNPRPRIVFPHALGVGIASRHEEVELELCQPMALADLEIRLAAACGETVALLALTALPPVKKSRQIVTSQYRILGWPEAAADTMAEVVGAILALPVITVERGPAGDRRSLDIRPFLAGVAYDAADNALEVHLVHTPAGSARPDEVARLAADGLGVDWRDLEIYKTGMELA
ncbi:MAG: TIGR03936 family radical SAM-associated protein [Planctomycetes bacterium]|nr:TIGR03936 family radical SAM-associated protein [Planctomycetota bacterium]